MFVASNRIGQGSETVLKVSLVIADLKQIDQRYFLRKYFYTVYMESLTRPLQGRGLCSRREKKRAWNMKNSAQATTSTGREGRKEEGRICDVVSCLTFSTYVPWSLTVLPQRFFQPSHNITVRPTTYMGFLIIQIIASCMSFHIKKVSSISFFHVKCIKT